MNIKRRSHKHPFFLAIVSLILFLPLGMARATSDTETFLAVPTPITDPIDEPEDKEPNTLNEASQGITMSNPANRPAIFKWPLPGSITPSNVSRYPNSAWSWTFLGLNPGYECPAYPAALYDPASNVNVWRNPELPESQDAAQADRNGNGWIDCYGQTDPAGGHVGTDITASNWTPIYAAADGWVNAIVPDKPGYNYVRIKHNINGSWWFTRYLHIQSDIPVSNGQWVEGGKTVIGYVGSDHLHFELGVGETHYYAVSVNPWGRDNAPWDGCMWEDSSLCRSVTMPTSPANQNIVRNSDFGTNSLSEWWAWGDVDHAFYGDGVLYFKRRATSNGGAIGQSWNYSLPKDAPIEVVLQLANTSGVEKRPGLFLRSGDNWDVSCWFTIPPGSSTLQTYIMRGITKADWYGFNFEIWPDPPDGIPDVLMDNVVIQYRPDLTLSGTECIYPDTTLPDGKVVLPADGTTIADGMTSVSFTADAWDDQNGSGVQQVEFYISYDDAWHQVGADNHAPYAIDWVIPSNLTPQQLIFTIHVIDRSGNRIMDPGGYHYVQYAPCVDCGLAGSPWPALRGGMKRNGRSNYPGPDTFTYLWSYFDEETASPPAIGNNGMVFIGMNKTLYAFSNDGRIVWSQKNPSDKKYTSAPSLTKRGDLYIGADDGYLYAYTIAGTYKWRFPTGGWIDSNPAIASDGTIYFGSSSSSFYALTPEGRLKWSYPAKSWIKSSPALGDDGSIYFGSTDKNIYALHQNGTLKWKYTTNDFIDNSPALSNDGSILYIGSLDGYLYALRTDNGELVWKIATSGRLGWASPAVGKDGTIFISSNNDSTDSSQIYALKPDGQTTWMKQFSPAVLSSPTIGSDGRIYISSAGGNLYALSPTSGNILQSLNLGGWLNYNPVIGPNKRIYVTRFWPAGLFAIGNPKPIYLPFIRK